MIPCSNILFIANFLAKKAGHLMRIGRLSNALECLLAAMDLNQHREPYTEEEEKMMIVSKMLLLHLQLIFYKWMNR